MKVKDVVTPFKLYSARVYVKQTTYTGNIDVTVSAQNPQLARQLLKSMYGIEDHRIGSIKEIKFN
jgi:hypothetical protein